MIRRPPRSTQSRSSAASDVYKRQAPDSHREPVQGAGNRLATVRPHTRRHHTTAWCMDCLLYTSPSPRDRTRSRMPSSA